MYPNDQRIILTGCASGMGESTLKAYAVEGANVIGMDVNYESGTKAVASADGQGYKTAGYLHVDVADRDSVEAAFAEAVERLGGQASLR
ncbi:MAG: SDR family NAD(P)-dependent oxidoreductase [Burkholderiales bacterium]|nr:SDR family NAD(P)-dependent oxidoreductase [Burkholderiales bacterium]